jgi:predicted HTH domain antitoxin
MLDLIDLDREGNEEHVEEKLISLDQAARLLELEPEAVVPLARQRLAQINDEFEAREAAP